MRFVLDCIAFVWAIAAVVGLLYVLNGPPSPARLAAPVAPSAIVHAGHVHGFAFEPGAILDPSQVIDRR